MAIKHGVHDTDTHFIIDPISRAAKNDGLKKVSIVRDDHNSEVCTFELPRYVEGHDMSLCNMVEVHYLNTHGTTKAKSTGIYAVTDFGLMEDDQDKVAGSWLIDCLATKYPGSLAFSIHFACVDESGTVAYWWSSATNTSISVLDSINLNGSGGGGGSGETSDLQDKVATPAEVVQVIRPDNGYYGLSKVTVGAIPEEYVAPAGSLFVGANGEYEVKQFESILVNVPPSLQDKTFTANGVYTPSEGFDGFGKVDVNISDAPAVLQEKKAYPATFDQSLEPDEGFDGLSKVTVKAMKLQSVTVEKNGEVVPDHGFDGLASVTINVPEPEVNLQSKSMEVTENGDVEIVADGGYAGLERVTLKVDVEGAGKLQTKIIEENGEHEPDEDYDGFSKVKVVVPQHVYTGEATVDGTHPVYGGPGDSVSLGGYAAIKSDQSLEVSAGALYTEMSFNLLSTGDSTSSAVGSGRLTLRYEETSLYTRVYFLQDGVTVGTNTGDATYDTSKTGYKIRWTAIFAPGVYDAYPYGCIKADVLLCTVNSAGDMQDNRTLTRYIGFANEAEYNAAVNLVHEPTTIIKINEETFYVDEETEGGANG